MLTPIDRRKLGLEALMADRTVKRAYAEPDSIRESTWLRLRRAALKLGLVPPPAPARVAGAKS